MILSESYRPVRRQEKLSIQVAEQIKDLILGGKLNDGDLASEDIIQELENILTTMCSLTDDPQSFAEKDFAFHVTLARASGNPLYEILLVPLQDENVIASACLENLQSTTQTYYGINGYETPKSIRVEE